MYSRHSLQTVHGQVDEGNVRDIRRLMSQKWLALVGICERNGVVHMFAVLTDGVLNGATILHLGIMPT